MTNRYQCFWGECSSGYYYLADLEKQTQMALVPLIENPQPHTHCHPLWSPSGRFFAFQIGCDTFPSQVVVFDAASNKVLIVIDPYPGTSGVELIEWLSDTELVYRRGVFVQEYNDTFILHQILSTETLNSELLADLPVRTPDGNIFDLYGAEWAEDGKRVAALGPGSFYTSSLVIVDVRGQIVEQFPFDRLRTFWHIAHPIWSDSGQKVAYISAETLDSDIAIVNILDRDGRVIYNEKLSKVTRLKFAWLTPNTVAYSNGSPIEDLALTKNQLTTTSIFRLYANIPAETEGINLISLSEADNLNSHISLSVDQGGSSIDFYTLLPLNETRAFIMDDTHPDKCEKQSEKFKLGNIPNFVVGSEICIIMPEESVVVKLSVFDMDLREGWVDVAITIIE